MNDTDEDRATDLDARVGASSIGAAMNRQLDAILSRQDPDLAALDDDRRDAEVRAQIAAQKARELQGLRRIVAAELKSAGGFHARTVDAALAEWPSDTAALAGARKWLGSQRTALVLAGGVGAGKSTAAAWLALDRGVATRLIAEQHGASRSTDTTEGLPVRISASELEARGRYDKDLRKWLRGRSMLVLDDLGVELLDDKGAFWSLFDETLDEFYGDRRRIVITTNLRAKRKDDADPPQFVERYGARVSSRLQEIGLWHDCGVQDLRRGITPIARSR